MRPLVLLVFGCAMASTGAAAGQAAHASATSNPSSEASSTILHTKANLVLVDVVVTDQGRPVEGIDRGRFHILEDGREQTIVSFDEHRAAGPSPRPAASAALPPHTYTNIPAYPPATAVNVLLLDGLNTPVANQMDVHRQMLLFMGQIAPGTPLAIFTLASRLRMVTEFTTNAAELTNELKGAKTPAQQSVVLNPQADQLLDSTLGDMANLSTASASLSVDGMSGLTALRQFQTDLTSFQTDLRVSMTLEAMQQLARYLSAIPGRKNLIWFSGSFPLAIDPDDSLNSPFEAMRSYSDEVRETDELLSAARVAVYPVDARGLMTTPMTDASYTQSTNLMSPGKGRTKRATANNPSVANDENKFMKQTMQEQASMAQIAQDTGGKEYINTNGLKDAVASAIENGSSYYTIGYLPAAKTFDGQFRKIQVRMDGAGYQLAYRNGYYADSPGKATAVNPGSTSLIVAAIMHGAPFSTQILFRARVLAASDPLLQGADLPAGPAGEMAANLKGPVHRYAVDLTVDSHGIAFAATPDGAQQAQVEFVLVAYDADGNRANYLDRGFNLKVQPGQFEQIMANGIRFRMALDMPAGHGSLRIAVRDLATARAGSLEIPMTVAPK